jgi:hypothetical protein
MVLSGSSNLAGGLWQVCIILIASSTGIYNSINC